MARLALWLFIGLFAAACSTADTATENIATAEQAPPSNVTSSEDEGNQAAEMTVETEETSTMTDYNAPEWASLELVDARTGAAFTLADFAGKVVFVEPMATWCSNCRAQQSQIARAMEQVNSDEVIFISLSVESGLSPQTLSNYAESNGFPQIFAVATPELLNELVAQFGRTITNPPATPHFTIAPDGTVSALSTGQHNSAAVLAKVTALQDS